MIRLLASSARAGKALLALAIVGGVALPPVAHALRGLVPIAVVGLSTLVLIRVDVSATLAQLRRPRRFAAVIAVQMLGCPVLAWAAVRLVPLEPGIGDAVVLFATGAAIVSAPAYARLLGLDAELALLGALVGTLLLPLTAPPIAWALTGVKRKQWHSIRRSDLADANREGVAMQALSGTMWKVVEASAADDQGREVPSPIGQNPLGFVVFEVDRMVVAVTDARPAAIVGPSRTLLSYTGPYHFDGAELVTRADATSRPDMAKEQVRDIRFENDGTRMIVTPKAGLPGHAAGVTFVWERIR